MDIGLSMLQSCPSKVAAYSSIFSPLFVTVDRNVGIRVDVAVLLVLSIIIVVILVKR